MPFGYVGNAPSQVARNNGVYSIKDSYDITKTGHFGNKRFLQEVTGTGVNSIKLNNIYEDEFDVHFLEIKNTSKPSGTTSYLESGFMKMMF